MLLKDHMLATGDFSLRADEDFTAYSALGSASEKSLASDRTNNYQRPQGMQNVGNHLTGRNSSRVLAPPGGASQISFGEYQAPPGQGGPPQQQYNQGPPPQEYQPQYSQPPQQQYSQAPAGYDGGGGGGGGGGYAPPPQQGYSGPGQPGGGSPGQGGANNNYSRPNGMQNVGNFLTDRPSSRVLAPPGGKSQISFG